MIGRPRLLSLAVAAIAIAFFAAPVILRAAGSRAVCCPENHPFAPAPKLADGWNVFDETTRFLTDRMPGRQRAVKVNTWISEHIWNTAPRYGPGAQLATADDQALPFSGHADLPAGQRSQTPLPSATRPVAFGRHGWLFLQYDFDYACRPFMPVDPALQRWIDLVRIIRRSGRRVVLVVAPNKSTIYPEFVAHGTPNLGCGRAGSARLWRAVDGARAHRAGVFGLLGPLRVAKAADAPQRIFYRKDTHWNTLGALTLVRTVLPALDPRLHVARGEVVDLGTRNHTADLTVLFGVPLNEPAPTIGIRRAAGAPVIAGPSLLVGDSFTDAAYPLLAPYFATLRRTDWSSPNRVLRKLQGARTVVLEVVEREFTHDVAWVGGRVTPRFLRRVSRQLRRR